MGKFLDDRIVDKVRQAPGNDIVDVISEHLNLQRKGKEFLGLCPFHQDSNPSLYVNPDKQIFKCFACGVGGDVFKFVQLRENITFPQALERLAERAGITIEKKQSRRTEHESNASDPKLIARVNSWAMRFWQACYADPAGGEKARSYVQQRQIDDEAAMIWGLGFAPDDWSRLTDAARKAGISDSLLVEAGLAVRRKEGGLYDKFRNRLMFPIVDTTGRVIGFGGRTLGDDPAKYMNSPTTSLFDKSNSLYGLDKARHEIVKQGRAVVVEGYTDVMMSHQFGVCNVVAALGTSFTAGHARMLRRFASEIVMVLDSDVAGVAAANRALEVCLAQNVDVKIASVPMGKDPCEFLLSSGREAFDEVLAGATEVLEYKWLRLSDSFNETVSIVDRKKAVDEFMASVARAMNSGYLDTVSKGLVVRRLSNLLGLSSDDVKKELLRIKGRQNDNAYYAKENSRVVSVNMGSDYVSKAYKDIIEVLLCDPALYEKVEDTFRSDDIKNDLMRQIAEELIEILSSGEGFSLSKLLSCFDDVAVSSAIVTMAEEGEKKSSFLTRIEQALLVIHQEKEKEEIKAAKSNLNSDDSLRLVTEKIKNTHKNKRNKSNLRKGIVFN